MDGSFFGRRGFNGTFSDVRRRVTSFTLDDLARTTG
jgi:hypothetical protein